MRSWGICALAPKLLELGAKKRITQELGRAASGASQECQFCLGAQGVFMNVEI